MALVPNQVNNFRVYIAGGAYLGFSDFTVPPIINQTDELRGSMLAGPIQVPVIGHVEDLTMSMSIFALFPGCQKFLYQTSLNIQMNGVVQYMDNTTGGLSKAPWNFLFTSYPKEFNTGRFQQGAKPDMTHTRMVTAMQVFYAGQRIVYLDKGNMVFEVDGIDYLSQDRTWL